MSESPSNSLVGTEPSTVAGPEQKHSSHRVVRAPCTWTGSVPFPRHKQGGR